MRAGSIPADVFIFEALLVVSYQLTMRDMTFLFRICPILIRMVTLINVYKTKFSHAGRYTHARYSCISINYSNK